MVGCDFGSTTAKAVCLSPDKELLFSCYALSKGNPIDDAKSLFRQLREAIGDGEILGLGITGYGKDLLKDILGADCGVVETIAHATAGLHYFPDADCICDVGGVDVKIMILNNGTVTRFPPELAMLVGQRRVPARRRGTIRHSAERDGRRRVPRAGHAAAFDGMRRLPAERHRQPAAQGLAGGGNSRRRCARSSR